LKNFNRKLTNKNLIYLSCVHKSIRSHLEILMLLRNLRNLSDLTLIKNLTIFLSKLKPVKILGILL